MGLNVNPYSNTPIKNLEYIQNKALVIAPFEITKSGLLDTDLMLDTPGFITMYLYKKIVAGEDKEPTADRFKTIKTMSDLVLSGLNNEVLISTFGIPVIFKYDKLTGTRIIEKDLSIISEVPEYIDLTIDISNGDFSSETGSGGFFCVCQVQKIQKPIATTAFNEVANDAFLFMIPSTECRELSEDTEFELLDSDNKVINIKRHGVLGSDSISEFDADFFGDGSNIATYLFDGNVRDLNLMYNGTATNITYGPGKFGQAAIFNGTTSYINTGYKTPTTQGKLTVSYWVYLDTPDTSPGTIYGTSEYTNIFCQILSTHICVASLQATLYYFPRTKLVQGWNHIVVHHTTTPTLYINNQLVTHSSTNNSIGVNQSKDLWFGRVQNSYGSARIDQVRIFNRVLTETEVNVLYNSIPLSNDTKQGYRIYPILKINDHITLEDTFSPKYYLGTKYQRNLMEVLAPALKSKRTIYNLKDMYLVDDQCIQTLNKINILLENNQMIKLTERLYNLTAPLREKLNADVILEYLSTPVSGSQNSDIADVLKTSLMEDYNFTQEEITNLNDNLNTFKSRARIALNALVVQGQGLDQLRFNLPKTFIDGNRSKTEKKNLLVFGTNSGFNKFNLAGYTAPYSNISRRETTSALVYNDLTLGLPALSGLEDITTIKDFQVSPGDDTQHILFENGNLYACRYVNPDDGSAYNRDGKGFNKQSFPLKLIKTNVKSMYCGYFATFIIDNNNDVWALGGYNMWGNMPYDIYGINSAGNYIQNWTKVFSGTPENTPKKIIGTYITTWLLMESGEVFCTGVLNDYYTLDGSTSRNLKTWTSLTTGVKDIDCGWYHVCYTFTNGDIYVGSHANQNGLTTQSTNTTTKNTKALKILTNWIPVNQTIIQVECTYDNTYYLLSNGDVYGVGKNRAGQMLSGPSSSASGYSIPKKLYSNVKRIIPQLFGMNDACSVSMVELNTGEIKAAGGTVDYKFGYFADYNVGVTTPITLYSKVDKIFLTERNVLALIDGKVFNSGFNRFLGTNLTNQTKLEQNLNICESSTFRDILTNYKQQIPFTYIPLSTDAANTNNEPVFENLTDITGFNNSDIIIDIPNVL